MGDAWHRLESDPRVPLRTANESDAGADINFMVDTEKIDKLLEEAEGKPSPAFTSAGLWEKGADVRGLVAIEHLLFTCVSARPEGVRVRRGRLEARCRFGAQGEARVD